MIDLSKNESVTVLKTKNGDIEIDLTDLNTLDSMVRFAENYYKMGARIEKKLELAKTKSDKLGKNKILTEKQKYEMQLYKEEIEKAKSEIDLFLGNGSSEKLFGKRMSILMFRDFIEVLSPFIEKAQENAIKAMNETRKKYDISDDDDLLV